MMSKIATVISNSIMKIIPRKQRPFSWNKSPFFTMICSESSDISPRILQFSFFLTLNSFFDYANFLLADLRR